MKIHLQYQWNIILCTWHTYITDGDKQRDWANVLLRGEVAQGLSIVNQFHWAPFRWLQRQFGSTMVNLSTSNLHRRHSLEKCTEDPNHQNTPALYILWCMYQKGMQLNSGPQEVWQILVGLAAGWLGTSYHPLKRGLAAFGMELGIDGLKGRRWRENFFSARLDLSDFQNHE